MKSKILKQLSAACLMSILVPCGAFATMYIDHFDAPSAGQAITQVGIGTSSSFVNGLTTTFSGTRYLEVTKSAGSGGSHAVDINNSAYPSLMADSLEAGVAGSTKLIWDGNGDGIIDYTMAPVDLTEGGLNSVIDLRVIGNDLPGNITLNFGDGATNFNYTFAVPAYPTTFPTNIVIPFTEWTGVDFSQIRGGGMSLNLISSEDMRIDFVSAAPVPEPATFLLVGAGMVGIGLMKRRSKKDESLVSVSGSATSV